jgi:hypothetical protein
VSPGVRRYVRVMPSRWLLVGCLALLTLPVSVATGSAAASATRTPNPAMATVAFGHLLHHRYGTVRGYWTCPASQTDKTERWPRPRPCCWQNG